MFSKSRNHENGQPSQRLNHGLECGGNDLNNQRISSRWSFGDGQAPAGRKSRVIGLIDIRVQVLLFSKHGDPLQGQRSKFRRLIHEGEFTSPIAMLANNRGPGELSLTRESGGGMVSRQVEVKNSE